MKTFYLYTHLGLGDIIICNGLIREVCKKYPHVTIFCKPKYYTSVSFMFRDLTNLDIIQKDDHDANTFLQNIPDSQKYFLGHYNLQLYITKNTFDQCFYKQIGLNFLKRWSKYHVNRDTIKEDELFEQIAPKQPYAFIHDDIDRGFLINENYVDPNLVKFRPKKIDNIFLYCKILEQATEIHCMDSCFKHIADSLQLENKKLFYHLYVRGINNNAYAQSKHFWNKLVYR
jgi:hypothetical protein